MNRKKKITALAGLSVLVCMLISIFLWSKGRSDVLLFMVGGDLETDRGAATLDVQQIIRASKEHPGYSCTAYLCGSEKWQLPGLQDGHSYAIKISDGKYKILKDYDTRCGTTAEDLCEFLKYGKKEADLIFWGHGGSGSSGIGVNLLFGEDTLSLQEIKAALEQSKKHFRLIGFDACSMATLQAAWITAPYCDFFCASTEEEDISGWSYYMVVSVLADKEMSAEKLHSMFREKGFTVLGCSSVPDSEEFINRVLKATKCTDGDTLSELLSVCSDRGASAELEKLFGAEPLLVNQWPDEELPDDKLLPGIGEEYSAFLNRK